MEETEYKKPKIVTEWKNIGKNLFSIRKKFQQHEFQIIDDLLSSKNEKFLEKYRHVISKISLNDPEFIDYISEQAQLIHEEKIKEKLEKEKLEKEKLEREKLEKEKLEKVTILNYCMSSIRYGVEQKIINEKEKTSMQGEVLLLQPGPLMEQLKNLMLLTLDDHEKKSLVVQLIQKESKK